MPRLTPSWLDAHTEFGVDTASRLSGVPEPTLRLHIDQGRILGVRRIPGGKRLINREGLLAYLRARGFETRLLEGLERRRSPRTPARRTHVRLAVRDLGRGEGDLADFSASGFRAEGIAWEGLLPGLQEPVAFRVLDGRLKGSRGRVRLSRLLYRDGALGMGLKDLSLDDPRVWEAEIPCPASGHGAPL